MVSLIRLVNVALPKTLEEASFVMYRTREEEEQAIKQALDEPQPPPAKPSKTTILVLIAVGLVLIALTLLLILRAPL